MSTTDPINYDAVTISEEDSAYLQLRAMVRQMILQGPVYRPPSMFEQLATPRAIPSRYVLAYGRVFDAEAQHGPEGLESALDEGLEGATE